MPTSPISPAQEAAIQKIRRIMTICVVVSVGGTVFLIYEFGFAVRPHRLGFACMLAALYLVWSSAGLWFMHRSWMRGVRKML